MTTKRDVLMRRLIYQSQHRGTKEADLIFGPFAVRHVPTMTDDQLIEYETLLTQSDLDLYRWMTGVENIPLSLQTSVWKLLKLFLDRNE